MPNELKEVVENMEKRQEAQEAEANQEVPQTVQLTHVEALTLENTYLRQAMLQQQSAELDARLKQLSETIKKRIGVSMENVVHLNPKNFNEVQIMAPTNEAGV